MRWAALLLVLVSGAAGAQSGVLVRFDADPYCNWMVEDGAVKDRMISLELTAASTAIRDQITCSATIGLAPREAATPPVQAWRCVQRGASWCRDNIVDMCAVCTPPATKAPTFEVEERAQEAEWAREDEMWHREEAEQEREYCQRNYCQQTEPTP